MKIRFVLPILGTLALATSPAPLAFGKGKTDKAAEAKAPEPKPPQVIEISVTKEGFVPKEVKVKAGQPVKLQVTRKIEKTCAKDIVIKDYNISQPLPLDQTVTVTFTPSKAGSTRFACAMDMIAGVIVAE
jgi:plastocyanin domain-containing protein